MQKGLDTSFPRKRESSIYPLTLSLSKGSLKKPNEWFDRLTMGGF